MTTSCSLQARQGEKQSKRGLQGILEVVLHAARPQTVSQAGDDARFEIRGGRASERASGQGVELGAGTGLPAGGGKLADKEEAPKG